MALTAGCMKGTALQTCQIIPQEGRLCRLMQAAACTLTDLLQHQEKLDSQTLQGAAGCIAWAIDDGYLRVIIAAGIALQRAQAKLASSSLNEAIPDLGPHMGAPAGE